MLKVVAGVLQIGERYLLQQRAPYVEFPFRWETPGGKVEEHESLEEALRREWKEELGYSVNVHGRLHHDVVHSSVYGEVLIFFFAVTTIAVLQQRPQLSESGVGVGFFTLQEIRTLRLTPGTESFFKKLEARR